MKPSIVCSPPQVRRPAHPAGRTLRPAGATAAGRAPPELKPLSLRRNFSWVAAGSVAGMLSQWGLLIVLAHLGNLQMIGTVVLAFAICAPVNALAQLGLRGAVVTDTRGEYQFADYFALRLLTSSLALLSIAGIVVAIGYEPRAGVIVLLVAVGELFKALSDIVHALLQQHERMDRIGVSLMLQGPLMVAALALGIGLTGNLAWGVAGLSLAAAAVFFAYDLPNARRMLAASAVNRRRNTAGGPAESGRLKPRWDPRTLLRLTWLTLPLGVVLMLVALTTSLPRYMVSHYLGNHALGVFVSIVYLGMVGARVVTAVGQSAGARLAKYYAAGETADYCRLLAKLLAMVGSLGLAVVLLVAVAGRPILGLLYDADYSGHLDLAVCLMAAAAVAYLTVPLGIAVEAMRRFKAHMAIRGLSVLALLVGLPPLIRQDGLRGAALAMLLGSGCAVAGCVAVVLWAVRREAGRPGFAEAERAQWEG